MARLRFLALCTALLCPAGPVVGAVSSLQHATVLGVVTDGDMLPLPGVTVSASCPCLPGRERTVATDVSGAFQLPRLPPGKYEIRFELHGFMTVRLENVSLPVGPTRLRSVRLDSAIAEEIIVVTEPPLLARASELLVLAKDRVTSWNPMQYIRDTLELLGGREPSPPSEVTAGEGVISPELEIPIEESVEEIQIATSPLPADSSGSPVIHAITKSGSREYEGSLRWDVDNPAWSEESPYEEEAGIDRDDEISHVWQGTLGGYLLFRDRLWFFLAGERESSTQQGTFRLSQAPDISTVDGIRRQGKVLASLPGGSLLVLQGNRVDRDRFGATSLFGAAPSTAAPIHEERRELDLSWGDVLRDWLAFEVEASWHEGRRGVQSEDGGPRGAPFLSSRFLLHYGGPYGDASDPEALEGGELEASLETFASGPRWKTHSLKTGLGKSSERREGGLSPSGSGLVFDADPQRRPDGLLAFDSTGQVIPLWRNSGPEVTLLRDFRAAQGLRRDEGARYAYVNDLWTPGERWEINLGLRWERLAWSGGEGSLRLDADRLLPRLGALFRPARWDGRLGLHVGYGEYASGLEEALVHGDEPLRTVPNAVLVYTGPEGEGAGFAPGFDERNYRLLHTSVPGVNVRARRDLDLPYLREATLGLDWRPVAGGWVRAAWIVREHGDFVEDFVAADRQVVLANSDGPRRRYEAVTVRGSRRLEPWSVAGSWTWELEHEGRSDPVGDRQSFPTVYGDYPETIDFDRAFPSGPLDELREHRAWLKVDRGWSWERAGLGLGLLARYESGGPFSRSDLVPLGTAGLPLSQPVFFGTRGTGRFEDSFLLDLAVSWWMRRKAAELSLDLGIENLLDEQALRTFDTTVFADPSGPRDGSGLPATYVPSARFGRAYGRESYVRPRTFRAAMALRFGAAARD